MRQVGWWGYANAKKFGCDDCCPAICNKIHCVIKNEIKNKIKLTHTDFAPAYVCILL